jgi:hypothetical protein
MGILKLLSQPSSFAGFGLIANALAALVANLHDAAAWTSLFAGLVAVCKSEGVIA